MGCEDAGKAQIDEPDCLIEAHCSPCCSSLREQEVLEDGVNGHMPCDGTRNEQIYSCLGDVLTI